MATLLYSQPHVEIWDDPEGWLYVDWRGTQTVSTVQDGCEQMLQLMSRKHRSRVLNDVTHMEGAWIGAAEWVARDWFPRMRRAGLQELAWVRLAKSQAAPEEISPPIDPGVSKIFFSCETAADWLRERTEAKTLSQRITLPKRPHGS